MNIFWFRRDLRLEDNSGLAHALSAGKVLPIFIFDTDILSELPTNDSRVTFIHDALSKINHTLAKYNSSLAVFHGRPKDVFSELISQNKVAAVFTNRDYEPYALQRDAGIEAMLGKSQIAFRTFKDHVIFERDEIVKDDTKPYVVFTPYSNKWKTRFDIQLTRRFELSDNFIKHDYPFLSLEQIGFKHQNSVADVDLSPNLIANYNQTRNFPYIETSKLGPHLRFGTISIRDAVSKALDSNDKTFLNELIWREFFMQILWHFPQTVTKSFRPKYDSIKWRNNEAEFEAWCQGKTGYPIVDAGMRELSATGFMHNRVRMVVASFLCKHLLIDWRWGEAYFALKLNDYEQASNVGNWQWAAGSGVDAAPYFRIFNPMEQAKKFDSKLSYIKKWVPELETFDYPNPIVDHKLARERCLEVYRDAVG